MSRTPSPLYLAKCDYGRSGHAFRETDQDKNSREEIVSLIATGEIRPLQIFKAIFPCDELPYGGFVDVTDEVMADAIDRRMAELEGEAA